jgi:hypothetical protein
MAWLEVYACTVVIRGLPHADTAIHDLRHGGDAVRREAREGNDARLAIVHFDAVDDGDDVFLLIRQALARTRGNQTRGGAAPRHQPGLRYKMKKFHLQEAGD